MNYAIILAAGQSQRMGAVTDKLLEKVAGHPLLYYTIAAFNDHDGINAVTVVVNEKNQVEITKIAKEYKFKKVRLITLGGLTRQESLNRGLSALTKKFKPKKNDLIVVHNGANPMVSYKEITEAIESAQAHGACIVGHKINDTVKEVKGKSVTGTLDRENLFAAQTPQIINFELLKKALAYGARNNIKATDEAMLVEFLGHKVVTVEADEKNIKITTQEDLNHLKFLLGENEKHFRVGIGQDSHVFEHNEARVHKNSSGQSQKRGLVLAGVHFPDEPKLKANSDGDVVLHAVFNALSQALGSESLGFYADEICEKQGVKDSSQYLKIMLEKIEKENFKIGNLGLMIECKRPKIDPLAKRLKESLGKILKIDTKLIGITATSGENLTSFGLGLGIQCFAIVSLFEKPTKSIHKNAKSHTKIQRKSKSKSGRTRGKK